MFDGLKAEMIANKTQLFQYRLDMANAGGWYLQNTTINEWALFSISTRNLIGFGQISAHPLLDNRWEVCAAITWCSHVFTRMNRHVYTASRVPYLSANLIHAAEQTLREDLSYLD